MIRIGTSEDIPAVSALWLEMVKELAPAYTPDIEMWQGMAQTMMNSGFYTILVAIEDGQIAGFLDFFLWPEPSTGKKHGVGQHFYVRPDNRGALSGRLYKKALQMVKQEGAQIVEFCCFDYERPMWMKKGYMPIRSMVRRDICLTR